MTTALHTHFLWVMNIDENRYNRTDEARSKSLFDELDAQFKLPGLSSQLIVLFA